ncbi:hypothetical protein J5X98_25775 [Leptothermofonsia sichuanensis E412]|uniref:hypothetical protein n=1 Tax=Leptothermofonsia sichuanensis TaxID=2917832 RepID=UPI001CA648CF|nr:hypothetical protein [Leptothermofonsia sichuanensis]QZZ20599.1 hypothetical protein J5X98_25775 [Leptothermofonsia sichuanensis E412]
MKNQRGVQSRWLRFVVGGAISAIALVGIILMQQAQLNRPSLWVSDPKQAEEQEALRLELLQKSPTFGFDNLLADWVFLNFLQYYGDTPVREQTGYSISPQYFDLITRLDPRFVDVYLFLSGTLSYQLGKPELAIQYMDRGIAALSPKIHPSAYQVWRFKGLDQLLLLGDIPGSIHSHEMAAEWAKGTPDDYLVPIFQEVADFLRKDPNSVPVRLKSWASIYAQATQVKDKQTQARAKQEIGKLGYQLEIKDGQMYLVPKPVTFDKPQAGGKK